MVLLTLSRLALVLFLAPKPELGGSLTVAGVAFLHGLRFDAAGLAVIWLLALVTSTVSGALILKVGKLTKRSDPQGGPDRAMTLLALWGIATLALLELHFFREYRARVGGRTLEFLGDIPSTTTLFVQSLGPIFVGLNAIGLVVAAVLLLRATMTVHDWAWRSTDEKAVASLPMRAVLVIGLVIVARGGFGKAISPADANGSSFWYVNQLTLSAPFTLEHALYDTVRPAQNGSASSYGIVDMTPAEVRAHARSAFAIDSDRFVAETHPALRRNGEEQANGSNVVVIVLESFASHAIGTLRAGGGLSLTPEFDGLATEGLLFTRFLANGPDSGRSLPAIVAGLPCIPGKESLTTSDAGQQALPTLASVLGKRGYSSLFVSPGSPGWERLGEWAHTQGFEWIVGDDDFDSSQRTSVWGVPDHVLYDRAFDTCERLVRDGPIVAVITPSTNQPPFALPHDLPEELVEQLDAFEASGEKGAVANPRRRRSMLYADWALGRFIDACRSRSWGRRTLFVIVGDHGIHDAPQARIDLDRHHVPLLLLADHAPSLRPGRTNRLGSQVDILPTVLSFVGVEGPHAAWGRDLLDDSDEPRYAVLGPHSGGHAYGIFDESGHFLIDQLDGERRLYFADLVGRNLVPQAPDDALIQRLSTLGRCYLSTAHRALLDGRAGPLDPR